MTLSAGDRLGRYEIIEPLGAGGMGEVYRARDERLDRDVAIKVLPEEVAQDQARLARFEREAKLLASLNHTNIATLYSFESAEVTPTVIPSEAEPSSSVIPSEAEGRVEESGRREGRPVHFLVMELAEGETLAERIKKGSIPLDDALPIALQIAEGLEAAHEQGIIHRDLKPANVMLSPDDRVKILDFGLAKAWQPIAADGDMTESPTLTAQMTAAGVIVGTAAYMSPEQARGKAVDKRSDIWAFGCVLFEMITGTRAFSGATSTEILAAIIKEDPGWDRLPADTLPAVRRLLQRCLTKNPRDRLHDIADARVELQSVSVDDLYRDESGVPVAITPASRTWLPWGVAAVLAVSLIAAVITGALSDRRPNVSPHVIRTTIDLPDGTELTHVGVRRWNGPMRNELALSPDGRTLVFSAATGGDRSTARLYRRPMDRVEAVVIPGTEGASTPFFSPDGRWIAFWAGGALKKVSLDGGLPIILAEYRDPAGSFPYMGGCWSTSGTIFIGTHMDGLQRVDADGGQLEALTVPDRATEFGHRMPQVLPGERAVLFTVAYSFTGAEGHIEVVSLDTGERQVVVQSGLDGRFVPSGHLLFLQRGILMAAPFDPDQLQLTGRPVPVLEGVMHATNLASGWANSGAGLLAVSDNGTLVFAPGGMAPDARTRFVWADRNGGTQPVSALPEGFLAVARISPDGRWLAFTTSGLESALWVHDLARETTTRLTSEGRVSYLSWTPDSERLVVGYSQGGVPNLFWLSHLGNEPMERLTTSEYVQQPGSWSPDGRYLAYVQWLPFKGTAIWLLDTANGESEPILQSEHDYTYPDFSPDGRWLAYTSDESGRLEVWITSFPGREKRMPVSNDGGRASLWSPDGREVYYISANRLMVVEATARPDLTLGKPHSLFEGPIATTHPLRGYDITPDGNRFIFLEVVDSEPGTPPVRQLQVVFNWVEELKRLVPVE